MEKAKISIEVDKNFLAVIITALDIASKEIDGTKPVISKLISAYAVLSDVEKVGMEEVMKKITAAKKAISEDK